MLHPILQKTAADLAALHTTVTEVTRERDSFTDPQGHRFDRLPPFLRVALRATPGPGSDIRHEVWLPENWNGRFLGTGNGGIAGSIYYGALADNLRAGYAVANTDMGTSGGVACGVNNPDVHRDFGWRATACMTEAGKILTRAFYDRPIEKSYFFGCSTGGQQALAMAQRCPAAYDGIIAGVPANNRTHLHAYFLWGHNTIKHSGVVFERTELECVTHCAAAYSGQVCHSGKGVGTAAVPGTDEAYIDGFLIYVREHCPGLSEEKRRVLRQLYMGPVNPRTGERIYCGLPIGSELGGCGIPDLQGGECPHFYPFVWTFGSGYRGENFNFDTDMDRVDQVLAAEMNANDPDLSPFFSRGGKLLFFSGSADPCVPFPDAMAYYDRVAAAAGGLAKARESARYFLLPGQDHGASVVRYGPAKMNGTVEIRCMLDIIRAWCEEGVAPDRFDMPVAQDKAACPITVYPYGAEKDPPAPRPVCAPRYL